MRCPPLHEPQLLRLARRLRTEPPTGSHAPHLLRQVPREAFGRSHEPDLLRLPHFLRVHTHRATGELHAVPREARLQVPQLVQHEVSLARKAVKVGELGVNLGDVVHRRLDVLLPVAELVDEVLHMFGQPWHNVLHRDGVSTGFCPWPSS